MNSISKDRDTAAELLEAFVSDNICTGLVADEHQKFPPATPDKNTDSYFEEHKPRMGGCCHVHYGCTEDLQQILEEFWSGQPFLMNLAPSIAELAFNLENNLDLDEELPSFVYTL